MITKINKKEFDEVCGLNNYCNDCKDLARELIKENGIMESNLITFELIVEDLMSQCKNCKINYLDKLL